MKHFKNFASLVLAFAFILFSFFSGALPRHDYLYEIEGYEETHTFDLTIENLFLDFIEIFKQEEPKPEEEEKKEQKIKYKTRLI